MLTVNIKFILLTVSFKVVTTYIIPTHWEGSSTIISEIKIWCNDILMATYLKIYPSEWTLEKVFLHQKLYEVRTLNEDIFYYILYL